MRRHGSTRGAPAAVRGVRLVAALGLALGLVAGAAGAVNKWLAVGDSIMVGSTWPFVDPGSCGICPAIFDCSGGCGYSTGAARENCSIPRRLDVWLDGVLGAPDDVLNLGVGAEQTAAGVTRLPSEFNTYCPGSPGECIAMVLMHGTNDMFGTVSPESATFNLQTMIQEARSRNIDTLLMTIIRKIYEPANSKWGAYHDLVVALAASENVPLADPYVPLCPDTACFNANYWVAGSCPGAPGEFDVGHVDPQGYDIMNDLVTAAFPDAVPPGISTTSPAGDICSQTPQFVWPEEPTARWYALEVDTTTTWWEAAASCAGGTCTATPAGSLAAGAHSWKVGGRNLLGMGDFSATANFTVGPPPAPTAVAPSGSFFPFAPTYEWLEIPCATEYDYEVRDAMGNLEAQATGLLASAVCSGGRCRHQGATVSDADTYTFKVLARNTLGTGPLSATGVQFTILACGDPSAKNLNELEPSPVTTTQTVSHCGPVTAGPYVIESTGSLTVHTGGGFTAQEGFTVAGSLTLQSP